LREIDIKFCDPIVGLAGIDEHLLNAPVALVFGGGDVGVLKIARGGIEADAFVFDVVGVQGCVEAVGGPWGFIWRRCGDFGGEGCKGGFKIAAD
jgi:hypothetical protein